MKASGDVNDPPLFSSDFVALWAEQFLDSIPTHKRRQCSQALRQQKVDINVFLKLTKEQLIAPPYNIPDDVATKLMHATKGEFRWCLSPELFR